MIIIINDDEGHTASATVGRAKVEVKGLHLEVMLRRGPYTSSCQYWSWQQAKHWTLASADFPDEACWQPRPFFFLVTLLNFLG